jgi:hypothetical protein
MPYKVNVKGIYISFHFFTVSPTNATNFLKEQLPRGFTMKQALFHRCVQCDEAITNPICSDCLSHRMKLTIGLRDKKLAAEVCGFEFEGETTCLSCGKHMGLCAHCFSRDIYELLEEKKYPYIEEFVSNFDFELRRTIT